ncbi:MAG: FtsW/RodA/SpoVE family cell cycle protein, partial [Bacteroidia bacterium]
VGCMLMLLFQAFINMAVAVNLFPVTGQALPLVSMGGTSIWFTSISIGIILCVSRFCVPDGGKEAASEA